MSTVPLKAKIFLAGNSLDISQKVLPVILKAVPDDI
jgi:hypothetical protein